MDTRNASLFGASTPTNNWRRGVWIALLIAASVAFSLGFSCACPFAAFAATAALTLNRRDTLLLAGGVWLANQAVGFGLLNYPSDANTLAWGGVLGLVILLATLAAQRTARDLDGRRGAVVAVAAFVVSFAVYEGGLFVVAATLLGGTEDFVPGIVAQILEINAGAFVGLLLLSRFGAILGLSAKPVLGFPTMMGRA